LIPNEGHNNTNDYHEEHVPLTKEG